MREFDTKYTVRTDLATEARAKAAEGAGHKDLDDGIETGTQTKNGITVETLLIKNNKAAELCGKPCGKYVTVNVGRIWNASKEDFDNAANVIAEVLREFFPKDASCLLCAMGNSAITADALGPLCAENFIVTRHIKQADKELFETLNLRETMCICPSVTAKTGYEGVQSIKGIVDAVKPGFAVVVDALASRKLSRLATTVQICNTGLCPGSGVGNSRKEINEATLGIPVFAIGVPTVVEAQTLALDILSDAAQRLGDNGKFDDAKEVLSQNPSAFFVTPKDTDHIIRDTAKLVGGALNLALHKDMTLSEAQEFLS